MLKQVGCLLLVLTLALPAYADFTGHARVIDGDTLSIDGQRVRLFGIDAPEMAQRCEGPKPLRRCGEVAADAMAEQIAGKPLTCEGHEFDQYGRLIATCRVNGTDMSEWMVSNGYAMAFVRFSDRYVGQESTARAGRRGIWKTRFEPPWQYRAARWDTTTRGAPKGCPIKGNISGKGERIYHTPWGSRHYSRTKISTSKGERWFCSEDEALAAGWRAPLR